MTSTPTPIGVQARQAFLALARHTVAKAAGREVGAEPSGIDDLPSHGAFVTLHRRGRLRGCIGTFAASPSTAAVVREMAEAAALRDPRFHAVAPEEIDELDNEISLLTPLVTVEDAATIEVGRHGICVERGYRRGVLLPQVAVEHGWDRETFLAQTCVKAGLPSDAWQDPATRIEVFEAVIFGERDPQA